MCCIRCVVPDVTPMYCARCYTDVLYPMLYPMYCARCYTDVLYPMLHPMCCTRCCARCVVPDVLRPVYTRVCRGALPLFRHIAPTGRECNKTQSWGGPRVSFTPFTIPWAEIPLPLQGAAVSKPPNGNEMNQHVHEFKTTEWECTYTVSKPPNNECVLRF